MSAADAEAFARQVLAMPTDIALGFLAAHHDSTCECNQPYDAELTLTSMRNHWAGRL